MDEKTTTSLITKQQMFDRIKSAVNVKTEELEKKYQEFLALFKSRGEVGEGLELNTLGMLQTYYKKQLLSTSEKFKGIIFGFTLVNDYGAKRAYDIAINKIEENKELAIKEGYADEDGNPLYTDGRAPRKINLKNDKAREVLLKAMKEGDKEYKMTKLQLSHDKLNINIPIGREVEFKANLSAKSTDDLYILRSSNTTQFDIIGDKEVDLKKFAKEHLTKHIVKQLASLYQYHEENKNDFDRFVVVVGKVARINYTAEGMSDIIDIDDISLDIKQGSITCWVPKELEINFDENVSEILVIGKTGINKKEKLQLNVYGLWCKPEERIKKEEVQSEKIEEEKISIQDNEVNILRDEDKVEEIKQKPKKVEKKVDVKPAFEGVKLRNEPINRFDEW